MKLCWILESGCNANNIAAWVQALGTILAIFISAYFVRIQIKAAFFQELNRRKYESHRVLETMFALTSSCMKKIESLLTKAHSIEYALDTADAEQYKFLLEVDEVNEVFTVMNGLPIFEIADAEIIGKIELSKVVVNNLRKSVEWFNESCTEPNGEFGYHRRIVSVIHLAEQLYEMYQEIAILCLDRRNHHQSSTI